MYGIVFPIFNIIIFKSIKDVSLHSQMQNSKYLSIHQRTSTQRDIKKFSFYLAYCVSAQLLQTQENINNPNYTHTELSALSLCIVMW